VCKTTTSVADSATPVQPHKLNQNFPNPGNSSTTIQYSLNKFSQVKLTIYNQLGQKIRTLYDAFQNAGEHVLSWDATDDKRNAVSSGIYFYSVEADNLYLHRKMILIR
jgi:flagellar hook assembly protein FlgD